IVDAGGLRYIRSRKRKEGHVSVVQQKAIARGSIGINRPDNIAIGIHSRDRNICVGMAGKSNSAETAGMGHESMPFPVFTGVSANNDSVPAHVADGCTRGVRKPKCSELALKQQESMAHVFAVNESSRNASQIIERDSLAIRGRRRKGQCFKRAFSRG